MTVEDGPFTMTKGFKPSPLYVDAEVTKENVQKFLLRKVKRHRPNKDGIVLPGTIQELVKNYGDVCSNVSRETFKKFDYYSRFDEFTNSIK
jgi:hypothetical protein